VFVCLFVISWINCFLGQQKAPFCTIKINQKERKLLEKINELCLLSNPISSENRNSLSFLKKIHSFYDFFHHQNSTVHDPCIHAVWVSNHFGNLISFWYEMNHKQPSESWKSFTACIYITIS
jgi:hypothetical protein